MPFATAAAVVGAAASAATAINSLTSGPSRGQADAFGQQAADYRLDSKKLWDDLVLPKLDTTPYSKNQWLQDFVPETYDPVTGQVTQMHDSPIRADQIAALQQLQKLSHGGLQPEDLIALNQIQRAQASAGSSAAATAADALRTRGLGGAGAEYASRIAANQSASNSTANLYDNAMKAALDRQLNATTQAGNLSGNIRSADNSLSAQMAAINNNWNAHVMDLRTNAAKDAASIRNAANSANLAGHQTTADQNVGIENKNLDRGNSLIQQDFGNQTTKIAGQSNALTGLSTLASAREAAANQQMVGNNQDFTAGIKGIVDAGKTLGSSNNNSGSPSWFSNLFGKTDTNQPSDYAGEMVDTSLWGQQ